MRLVMANLMSCVSSFYDHWMMSKCGLKFKIKNCPDTPVLCVYHDILSKKNIKQQMSIIDRRDFLISSITDKLSWNINKIDD
jgi:hypothetical protein